jgi:hypothetical protein
METTKIAMLNIPLNANSVALSRSLILTPDRVGLLFPLQTPFSSRLIVISNAFASVAKVPRHGSTIPATLAMHQEGHRGMGCGFHS